MFLDALQLANVLTTSQVAVDAESPLNPAELQVLRAQYEKEGEMVGVQTKFNYAWVSHPTENHPRPVSTHHSNPFSKGRHNI